MSQSKPKSNQGSKPSFKQAFTSVMAALFGVQSEQQRQQDFQQSDPWRFIVVGVVAIVGFVLLLVGITWWVTP